MAESAPEPQTGEVWLHHKGELYEIITCAVCADNGDRNGERMVVYGNPKTGGLYVRFLKEFTEEVNGVPRFKKTNYAMADTGQMRHKDAE